MVAKRYCEFTKPIRQTIQFDKTLIDKDAKKVIKTLNKAGHEAYLVGGCIRDLLMGHKSIFLLAHAEEDIVLN